MKLHFKAEYNITYITSTSCKVQSVINGSLDICDDNIWTSKFNSVKEWLEDFLEDDLFFGEFTDIEWNKSDLAAIEEMFKQRMKNYE